MATGTVVMLRGDRGVEVELSVQADTVPEGTRFEVYRMNPNCPLPQLGARDAFIVVGYGTASYLRSPGKRQRSPQNLNLIPDEGGLTDVQVGDLIRLPSS